MGDLTIGRMSQLNCISERALRVYDEKGLLEPKRNAETGYRYYALDQCSTLDAIQQLQQMGFSLSEIKAILEERDADRIKEQLVEKEQSLQEQIANLQRTQRMLDSFKERCDLVNNLPDTGVLALEFIPERRALRFEVVCEDMLRHGLSGQQVLEAWQVAVCSLKREMLEKGYPLSYFRNVACVVPRQRLADKDIAYSQAFVFIDDDDPRYAADAEIVPANNYLTMYCDDLGDEDAPLLETRYLEMMLDYIENHDLKIVGDYIGEVVLDTAVFLHSGLEELVKMQIPVALNASAATPLKTNRP